MSATRDTIILVLVLALDTTTRAGSVAVTRDDQVLSVVEGDASRTHGERLPAEIDRALALASVRRQALDLLAVASGPGAFTGLRIGLAAMQGLALVLAKPVIGISALDALAATAVARGDGAAIATWMDAQRSEVFAACFRVREDVVHPLTPPVVGPPVAMLATLPFEPGETVTFIGDGAIRYRAEIEAARGATVKVVTESVVLAPAIARLARVRAASGAAGPPHALQPLYVRRPDAEIDRDRKAEP